MVMTTSKLDLTQDPQAVLDPRLTDDPRGPAAVHSTSSAHSTSTENSIPSSRGHIALSDEGQARLVRLSGEINVTLRDQASAVLLQVATSTLPLIVEMHDVTTIDDTGIAFVYQLAAVESEQHMPVVLRGAPTTVLNALDDLGISDRFVVA